VKRRPSSGSGSKVSPVDLSIEPVSKHLVVSGFRLRVKLRRTTVALAEVVSRAFRVLKPLVGSSHREEVERQAARQWRGSASAWSATAGYFVATVALTWPTITGLTTDIPWDLGDSLLISWILGWDNDHLLRFLGGDLNALQGFWTTNIFGREPLTLAYAEHLLAQAIPILPLYAATKNLILCYNLLFFSTFVLSGLGMYLLVRDLTGSARAAFVAGLIYAFAPYRLGQFSHLQVLSSQWMPFVLFGFRRYFEHRRWPALVGASAALIAQNLSCGYFLFFFFPFVVAYVLFEIGSRHLWRDRSIWIALSLSGIGVVAATVPFLLPYLELRRLGMMPRPLGEVIYYSADVYSYLTAHGAHRLYAGYLRAFPKSEGDLFAGFIPLFLAGLGVSMHARSLWRRAPSLSIDGKRWVVQAAAVFFAVAALLLINILLTGGLQTSVAGVSVRARDGIRPLVVLLIALAVWAWRSPRARAFLRGTPGSALGFYVAALAVCFWMSLGPAPQTMGEPMANPGLYLLFYRYVPGFNGLRVPARFGMLFMLFLAILAGFGAQYVERRVRHGAVLLGVLGVLFLVEFNAAPINLNGTGDALGLARPPAYVLPGPNTLDIYRAVSSLPPDAVIAEFPFGDSAYDLRYMYYSTTHWHRLLNGYSGAFPPWYIDAQQILGAVPNERLDEAGQFLTRAGATHAIVHERAFVEDEGPRTSEWLRARGARELADYDGDKLFELGR